MKCPNCGNLKLHTVETFQTHDSTYRTKKCLSCLWKFTSIEEIADSVTIPDVVRKAKRGSYYRKA
jgi:transcriptional regulator NrdR family protein